VASSPPIEPTLEYTKTTLAVPSRLDKNASYKWNITQGGNGEVDWDALTMMKFPGGTKPTLSTTEGAVDVLDCISDGTNLRCDLKKDYK
jgi:hypothetical protein